MGIVETILMVLFATILSTGGTMISNSLSKKREQEARGENFELNEQAAENADVRARNFYTDIQSPEAQLKQLTKAGLSPSLYYSGSTGTQGVSNTGAMGAGGNGLLGQSFAMGTPKDLAETRLMNAQADKAEQEADNLNPESTMGKANLNYINALANNQNAMENYANTQNEIMQLTKESTIEEAKANAEEAKNNAKKSYSDMLNAGYECKITEATINERIEKQKETIKLIVTQRLKARKDMQLTDAEITNFAAQTSMLYDTSMREWAKVDQAWDNLDYLNKSLDVTATNFMAQLELEKNKIGFAQDHYWWDKTFDILGDCIHAGGYIIGLGSMKPNKANMQTNNKGMITTKVGGPTPAFKSGRWNKYGHVNEKGVYDFIYEIPTIF